MAATYSDWLKTEVLPKIAILDEAVRLQHGQAVFEAFLASPSNGIAPFIYWVRDQAQAASPPPVHPNVSTATHPAPSSLSNPGHGPLPAEGPGSLQFLAAAKGVELYEAESGLPQRYKPGSYLETEDFQSLNVVMRGNGWRWAPGFKAWVRENVSQGRSG